MRFKFKVVKVDLVLESLEKIVRFYILFFSWAIFGRVYGLYCLFFLRFRVIFCVFVYGVFLFEIGIFVENFDFIF